MNTSNPCASRIADHALLRVEIEDVELVDPGGDDDDGRLMHLLAGRRVMEDFEQPVAEHHLARRRRQVFANLEVAGIRHPDVPGLDIRQEVAEAPRRLSPFDSTAMRMATGLVHRKFVGATAFSQLRHQNAALRRSFWERPGVSYSMSCTW
jgi:hypothetical protein